MCLYFACTLGFDKTRSEWREHQALFDSNVGFAKHVPLHSSRINRLTDTDSEWGHSQTNCRLFLRCVAGAYLQSFSARSDLFGNQRICPSYTPCVIRMSSTVVANLRVSLSLKVLGLRHAKLTKGPAVARQDQARLRSATFAWHPMLRSRTSACGYTLTPASTQCAHARGRRVQTKFWPPRTCRT